MPQIAPWKVGHRGRPGDAPEEYAPGAYCEVGGDSPYWTYEVTKPKIERLAHGRVGNRACTICKMWYSTCRTVLKVSPLAVTMGRRPASRASHVADVKWRRWRRRPFRPFTRAMFAHAGENLCWLDHAFGAKAHALVRRHADSDCVARSSPRSLFY